MDLRRGDIVVCNSGGDYGKPRPAVVIQSDLFNPTHTSITVCPITSHIIDVPLFRLKVLPKNETGLKQISQIMVDKITTLPKDKIRQKIGVISSELQLELVHALTIWLGMN